MMHSDPLTWASESETLIKRTDAWVALGRDCYVRASEVVVIVTPAAMTTRPKALDNPNVRAAVICRNGAIVPVFVSAATVVKRLREVGA